MPLAGKGGVQVRPLREADELRRLAHNASQREYMKRRRMLQGAVGSQAACVPAEGAGNALPRVVPPRPSAAQPAPGARSQPRKRARQPAAPLSAASAAAAIASSCGVLSRALGEEDMADLTSYLLGNGGRSPEQALELARVLDQRLRGLRADTAPEPRELQACLIHDGLASVASAVFGTAEARVAGAAGVPLPGWCAAALSSDVSSEPAAAPERPSAPERPAPASPEEARPQGEACADLAELLTTHAAAWARPGAAAEAVAEAAAAAAAAWREAAALREAGVSDGGADAARGADSAQRRSPPADSEPVRPAEEGAAVRPKEQGGAGVRESPRPPAPLALAPGLRMAGSAAMGPPMVVSASRSRWGGPWVEWVQAGPAEDARGAALGARADSRAVMPPPPPPAARPARPATAALPPGLHAAGLELVSGGRDAMRSHALWFRLAAEHLRVPGLGCCGAGAPMYWHHHAHVTSRATGTAHQ